MDNYIPASVTNATLQVTSQIQCSFLPRFATSQVSRENGPVLWEILNYPHFFLREMF